MYELNAPRQILLLYCTKFVKFYSLKELCKAFYFLEVFFFRVLRLILNKCYSFIQFKLSFLFCTITA